VVFRQRIRFGRERGEEGEGRSGSFIFGENGRWTTASKVPWARKGLQVTPVNRLLHVFLGGQQRCVRPELGPKRCDDVGGGVFDGPSNRGGAEARISSIGVPLPGGFGSLPLVVPEGLPSIRRVREHNRSRPTPKNSIDAGRGPCGFRRHEMWPVPQRWYFSQMPHPTQRGRFRKVVPERRCRPGAAP